VKSDKTSAKSTRKIGDSSLLKYVTTQRQRWIYAQCGNVCKIL